MGFLPLNYAPLFIFLCNGENLRSFDKLFQISNYSYSCFCFAFRINAWFGWIWLVHLLLIPISNILPDYSTRFYRHGLASCCFFPRKGKREQHQIIETEHLMKALLEHKNGVARRIFSKAGVDNTRLLEATDKFIQQQPKVTSDASGIPYHL